MGVDQSLNASWIQAIQPTFAMNPLLLNPNGGNVGIGTTAPSYRLHVADATSQSPSVIYHNPAAFSVEVGGAGGGELACSWINSFPYTFWMQSRGAGNASVPLAINPLGGNVGIGTTSPGSPLHVTNSGAASTSGQAVLTLDATNDGGTLGSGPALVFATTGVPVTSIRSITDGAGAIGLAFSTYNGGTAERMRIRYDGKVGIGNTGPSYALDVTGDVNCTGAFRVNGTPISAGGGVTTQSNVTGSRVGGNIYRNTTGKAMMVNAGVALTAGTIVAYSDAAASPTTVVANAGLNSGGTQTVGVSFWVLNNNYYKVVGGTPAYWIEWT
jgi:hypothetical protein